MSDFDKIAAALVKAQSAMPLPEKNREVTVQPKNRPDGSAPKPYKFWYTTLDELVENVRPALTQNGLWFTQEICGEHGKPQLKTTLWHESGQHIVSVMPVIVASPDAQAFGSAVSYAKRYALSALLGQPSDDDDDANAADGNAIVDRKDKPRAPSASATPSLSGFRIFRDVGQRRLIPAEAKRKFDTKALQSELWQCQDGAEVAMFIAAHQADFDQWPLSWLAPFEDAILAHEAEIKRLGAKQGANGNGTYKPQSTLEAG